MAFVADRAEIAAPAWLRGRDFDIALIFGLTGLALTAGAIIAAVPLSLGLILLADNWILGFPHVMSTFARIAPDRATMKQHRFLLFGLPVIVCAATAALALGFGIALVATIYFYWQWYHTMRQSWGIAQLYRRKANGAVRENPVVAEALFALVPLWGLLHRLTTAPTHFLYPNLQIIVPHVPVALANGVGVIACAGLAYWAFCRIREAWEGELALTHTLFSASHYLIFIVGYILMDNISGGWIVTNIWHTGQYMMLVWMFNENIVQKASPKGWFWSLTKDNRGALYFAACLISAFVIYLAIARAPLWSSGGLLFALIASQTLNFNHFITDAVIWRAKRKPVGAPT
jgi:hypothetical protein